MEYASQNEDVRQKIDALKDETDRDAVVSKAIEIAKEAGFTLSAADFAGEEASGELSDDELDAVAGGKKCGCFVGGSGSATVKNYWDIITINYKKCTCPVYGTGDVTRTDISDTSTKPNYTRKRCQCIVGGLGLDE